MNDRMNTAYKRISVTVVLSVLAMLINYLISLALTPYITTHVGTDAYGFVSLAKTISNYGIIVTGCLNSFSARYITISYHKGDIKKANQYFSTVVLANVGLLIATVVFELFFIWKLELFIRIPAELVLDVKTLFALDITNYMLLALANSFTVSAYVKNRLDILEVIKFAAYLTEAIVLIVLFRYFSPRIIYVGIGLIVSTFVLGFCNYLLSRKSTPDLVVKINSFSCRAVKDLVLSGIWNSINSLGNLLNSGLDLWVSNLMLSAVAMGELSIVKTVSTIVSSLEQLLSRPFHPYLLKSYSQHDTEGVVRIFKLQMKFSGYVTNMLCAGLICFGTAYYKLWTPGQDINLLYRVTIVTVIGFLFEGMIQPLFYTYTLTLKNRIPCYVTILSGFLNVLGMFILLKYTRLELYAVVGTTTVLGVLTYMVFTPLYTAHCLKVKWHTFYPEIFRIICAEIFILLISGLLFRNKMPSTWLELIAHIGAMCIVGTPIYIVCVFRSKELKSIINRMRKK